MKLTEIHFAGVRPIDSYGPGFFRVAGLIHTGPLALFPGAQGAWAGFEDAAPFVARRADFDVLFVGTGAQMLPLPAPFRSALEAAGIGIEPMATPAACRSYNVCLAEGRRIAAALVPV